MMRMCAGAFAFLALLAGCVADGSESASAAEAKTEATGAEEKVQACTPPKVEVPRDFVYDLISRPSPEELVEEESPALVATGVVEDIRKGRDLIDDQEPLPVWNVVVQVRVTEKIFAAEPDLVHDGRVYFELAQGASGPDNKPVHPVSEFEQGIPACTKVMLFLDPARTAKEQGYGVEHAQRGLPDGARLLEPGPWGATFESKRGLVGAHMPIEDYGEHWQGFRTIEDIAERVRDLRYYVRCGNDT